MIAGMQILIVIGLVLALLLGPNLWVQRVMSRYRMPDDRYGGTGGELARKLLDELGLNAVRVEEDRKSTRLNSSHSQQSRMPSSA